MMNDESSREAVFIIHHSSFITSLRHVSPVVLDRGEVHVHGAAAEDVCEAQALGRVGGRAKAEGAVGERLERLLAVEPERAAAQHDARGAVPRAFMPVA